MEAEQRRRLIVRKPLSDCTNTTATATATSSQSSSASTATVKPSNPKLSSVIKTLFADLNPQPSRLPPPPPPPPIPSTPSRRPPTASSAASGTSDFEAFEPRSVYTRRPSAVKRKSTGKENTVPLSCPPAPKTQKIWGKAKQDGQSSVSKESTAPRKKKQRAIPAGKNVSKHALPRDFIEKQRAYFAEIDAFELLEEEVDDPEETDTLKQPETDTLKQPKKKVDNAETDTSQLPEKEVDVAETDAAELPEKEADSVDLELMEGLFSASSYRKSKEA